MQVVVVDDDERMVELVSRYLEEHGHTAVRCFDGRTALTSARDASADVVVLDRMLPGLDGVEVCRTLRREGNDVPVLMLTARGAVRERVTGLESGADDYLVKPFALEELHARLRAIRRRRTDPEATLVVGDVTLDPLAQRVSISGEEVVLTRREFAMLRSLMQNAGKVVSRDKLFDAVWSDEVDIASNSLDVHILRLRHRLEGSFVRITTMRGSGYRLDCREP
jgi:two-component system, OmpR family, response regulator